MEWYDEGRSGQATTIGCWYEAANHLGFYSLDDKIEADDEFEHHEDDPESTQDIEESMDTDSDVDMEYQGGVEEMIDNAVMAVWDGAIESAVPNAILQAAKAVKL